MQTGRRASLLNYQESIGTSNLEYDNSSFDSSTFYDDDDDANFDSFFGATENRSASDALSPGVQLGSVRGIASDQSSSKHPGEPFAFIESANLPSANNHLIKKELTREELLFKRQQSIEELLKTEIDYVNDLKIVIDVYQSQILHSPYLSRQIAQAIFLNWDSLLECNRLFLNDLIRRKLEYPNDQQIQRIGDILKFHFQDQMCERYTRFCSNQMRSMKTYEQQMETNPDFKNQITLCNELNRNKLKLQDFTSRLLTPMQRITRYTLLAKEISKRTPADHVDHQLCLEAFREAENLCELVNRACHLAENEERLEWVQRHVGRCYSIEQRILFNSPTKLCGMRTLVHYGRLVFDSNNKPLLGLLFNDFFVLAKNLNKQKRIQKYPNLFICKEALESKYKIYKQPFMLDNIEVILNAGQLNDESAPNLICMLDKHGQFRPNLKFFVIKIRSLKKYFFLRAYNGHDRKLWIGHLSKAIQNYRIKKEAYFNALNNNLMSSFDCDHTIGALSLIVIRLNNFKTRNYVLNAFLAVSIGSNQADQDDHQFHFKSKVAKFKANQEHRFEAVFNFSSKFLLSNQMIESDYLTISCIEESPFAPDCLIGKIEIRIKDLTDELNLMPDHLVCKSYEFETFQNSQAPRPDCTLQIKFQPSTNQ